MTADSRAEDLRLAAASIDLAALSDHETPDSVRAVCARARHSVAGVHVASVCVYPEHVAVAAQALRGSPVRLASVAGGFPTGRLARALKLEEIRRAIDAGAQEIDAVVARGPVRRGDDSALHDEVAAFREACGPVTLKAILGTGALGRARLIDRASRIAMRAGADFIKTSTGKERVNATLSAGRIMARAIREHAAATGRRVGLKPSGGIRTAEQALEWIALVRRELGPDWLTPALFRIGASALLEDVASRLGAIAQDR